MRRVHKDKAEQQYRRRRHHRVFCVDPAYELGEGERVGGIWREIKSRGEIAKAPRCERSGWQMHTRSERCHSSFWIRYQRSVESTTMVVIIAPYKKIYT